MAHRRGGPSPPAPSPPTRPPRGRTNPSLLLSSFQPPPPLPPPSSRRSSEPISISARPQISEHGAAVLAVVGAQQLRELNPRTSSSLLARSGSLSHPRSSPASSSFSPFLRSFSEPLKFLNLSSAAGFSSSPSSPCSPSSQYVHGNGFTGDPSSTSLKESRPEHVQAPRTLPRTSPAVVDPRALRRRRAVVSVPPPSRSTSIPFPSVSYCLRALSSFALSSPSCGGRSPSAVSPPRPSGSEA